MSIYDQIAPWSLSIVLIFILGLLMELFNWNKILLEIMLQAFTEEGYFASDCLGL